MKRSINNLQHRTGTATFELLMSMPLLFSMIILITWMGFSMVGQSEVTIQARHDAWSKRFDDPPGDPLVFLQGSTLQDAGLVENDIVEGTAETSFEISPLVDGMATPESQMSLMVGSWDHRQLPLDELPNYKTHGLMAASALLGGFQNLVVQAGNIWNQVESAASDIVSWQEGLFDSLSGDADSITEQVDEQTEQRKQDLRNDLESADQRIAELDQELTDTNQQILDLVTNDGDQQQDEDGNTSTSAELEILLAKRNRITTQREDAVKDRNDAQRELNELS